MKKTHLFALATAFGFAAAVSLGAQAAKNETTITGCLQRADAAPNAGTSGTRSTSGTHGTQGTSGTETFVLLDAHIGTGMTGGSSGANGQSAATPNSGGTVSGSSPNATGNATEQRSGQRTAVNNGPWYTVSGNVDELRSHTGRRVEITGTLDTEGSVVGTSASVTDGPSGTLRATSIKIINPSCNQ